MVTTSIPMRSPGYWGWCRRIAIGAEIVSCQVATLSARARGCSRIETQLGPDAPDIALHCLLDRLPSDSSLWARLVQQYEIRFFFRIGVTGWNKGFGLSAPTVQRAAALGVRLDFDLYNSEDQPPLHDDLTRA